MISLYEKPTDLSIMCGKISVKLTQQQYTKFTMQLIVIVYQLKPCK